MIGSLQREALLDDLLDHSPAIHFVKNSNGEFLYYDRSFCERFAVGRDEWLGKSVFDLFRKEFASAYHADDLEVLTSGVPKVLEEASPGPDNSILYWRTHKFPIPQADGTHLLGGLLLDVSSDQETVKRLQNVHAELEAANVELQELSFTDGLTGLANRRAFDQCLSQEAQSGRHLALLVLDLDHFKSLNDTYGHPHGDDVLKEIAQILKAGCRTNDCVARLGGEEFGVLLSGASEAKAVEVAERLRRTIEQHEWPHRAVTASLGLAATTGHGDSSRLIDRADQALYSAKHSGKNCVRVSVTSA